MKPERSFCLGMKVFQLAADYFGSGIYKQLFAALEKWNVQNRIFVSTKHAATGDADDLYVTKKQFSLLARLLYFGKQHYLYREMLQAGLERNIDVVHAHTLFSTGYLACRLKRKYGLPYVVAVRNTDVNVFFRRMPHLRFIGRRVLREADRIVFLSPVYRDYVYTNFVSKKEREQFQRKTEIIPNGIHACFLNNKFLDRQLENGRNLHLLFVGRMDKAKNIGITVKTCLLLKERGIQIVYTLVGEVVDEETGKLLQRYDFIRYVPKSPKEQVLQYMREADIFVMPSHTETFGLVYAEAMSQGLPVIYTRGQGFDGQFEDGVVGYAVDDNNPHEIADRILDIAENYERFSQNCVLLVDKFDWLKIAQRYKEIYSDVVKRKQCGFVKG